MPAIARKRRETFPLVNPSRARLLSEEIERCGYCMRLWPKSDMLDEDGIRTCPNDRIITTETLKAETLEREAEKAELYVIQPNISQAVMRRTIPATVTELEDINGTRVYSGAPLVVRRSSSATLVLVGRGFSASDTITFSSGISASVSRTTTQTTLTLTIAANATIGVQDVTFNGNTLRGVIQVR